MIERIFNAANDLLMIAATLIGLAAPACIMYAYWILCSTH